MLERLRDREAEREERRLKARHKATDLLQAANAARADPELTAVATLVARNLNVAHCDILLFASPRSVVVVRADARVEFIQLSERMSPLDVLRTEGTVDRVHVFIPSQQLPTPLGILTVQNSAALALSSDERAFLDALGELIGIAIDSHRLPGGHELLSS